MALHNRAYKNDDDILSNPPHEKNGILQCVHVSNIYVYIYLLRVYIIWVGVYNNVTRLKKVIINYNLFRSLAAHQSQKNYLSKSLPQTHILL